MRLRHPLRPAFSLVLALALAAPVLAHPNFARKTKAACAACHTNPAGGPELTAAGAAFKADPKKIPVAKGSGADYMGANRCASCHPAESQAWSTTAHAHTLAVLESASDSMVRVMCKRLKVVVKGSPSSSPSCVGCHVTGYQLPGGYPAADSTKNASLANVTCEACHGPGERHIRALSAEKKITIHRGVTASTCTQCHTTVMTPKFDFAEFAERGVHKMAASH